MDAARRHSKPKPNNEYNAKYLAYQNCKIARTEQRIKHSWEILKEKLNYKDYLLKSDVMYKIVDDCELLVVPKGMHNGITRKAHERGHLFTKKNKRVNFQ